MEELDYPYAGEIKAMIQKRIEDEKAQQMQMQQMQQMAMQQTGGMGNAMPQMQG